ncbi:MAG TPA: hypothetical protein VFR37_21145 [Longimicrobium sp.]|nr:hypothetical protein [Longimicrobium sp.]
MTTDERRYGEEEVAAIFEAAANPRAAGGRALAPTDGFSLSELQAIGSEVGIAPERIAEAAAELDVRGRAPAPRRTQMGLPISVSRTVDLPREPTDREWAMLVAELQETFAAQGKDRSHGAVHGWTNGNLHAYAEPTDAGYRLRLGTLNGNAVGIGRMGAAALLGGLVLVITLLLSGEGGDALATAVFFAAMAVFLLGMNAVRLPRWAQEREEQMEHIATRALTLIRPAPEPEPASSEEGS